MEYYKVILVKINKEISIFIIGQFQEVFVRMENISIDPFKDFFNKMNKDLAGWLLNQQTIQQLLEDYLNTLSFLESQYQSKKLMVKVGENCQIKAKRIDQKIIVRVKEDLYVQLSREEAIPVVRSLVGLYEEKLVTCKGEISKIMASMRQMENLISSYQSLI